METTNNRELVWAASDLVAEILTFGHPQFDKDGLFGPSTALGRALREIRREDPDFMPEVKI